MLLIIPVISAYAAETEPVLNDSVITAEAEPAFNDSVITTEATDPVLDDIGDAADVPVDYIVKEDETGTVEYLPDSDELFESYVNDVFGFEEYSDAIHIPRFTGMRLMNSRQLSTTI